MNITKDQVTRSLQKFKERRDDLLHEDSSTFEHHLGRFLDYCQQDMLAQSILHPLEQQVEVDLEAWWAALAADSLAFPGDTDAELLLRYKLLLSVQNDSDAIARFGIALGKYKYDEWIEIFRVIMVRPFANELTRRIGDAANLASPEERVLQAVPLNRIPSPKEVRIFLSHKNVDKPLVFRYYNTLVTLGFAPWLDDPDMPAGANLERELLRGFSESCAAVFFITEDYVDEKYLATEVEYAIMEKRKKGNKFAIITLRYPGTTQVPALLTPYVYKNVENDLAGFRELLRALPIELGPIRWKITTLAD